MPSLPQDLSPLNFRELSWGGRTCSSWELRVMETVAMQTERVTRLLLDFEFLVGLLPLNLPRLLQL